MPMPSIFRNRGDDRLVNIGYDEIALGTGYTVMYGCFGGDAASPKYSLTPLTINAQSGDEGLISNPGGAGTAHDLDFDWAVKRQITIGGFTMISCSIFSTNGVGVIVTPKFRKWDGSTETELASTASDSENPGAGGYKTFCIGINVPDTVFKVGETLRVTILTTVTGADTLKLGANPSGSTLGWDTATPHVDSRLLIPIPTRIRL